MKESNTGYRNADVDSQKETFGTQSCRIQPINLSPIYRQSIVHPCMYNDAPDVAVQLDVKKELQYG